MNTWFSKNLGDALLAADALEHIKARFLAEYTKTNQPTDMALFIRHESEGRLQCEVVLYFSPASASVARTVDAVSCKTPSPDDLGLLVGSADARSVFFPSR
jgi:hypothetical protein